ncbi:MAG: carbohydrate-binding protein, partial [Rhodothermia bacterium]|nr:carbohydrate-binding protein [Rhodothermia bacterium]
AGLAQGTWGTSADRAELTNKFESVANWSASNNVPVMISEFGAIRGADFNSRMRHYSAYVEESLTHGIAFQAWDDGGDFGIYQREERGWNEVKDVLIHTYPDGPTDLATTVEGDSVLILSWVNRRSDFASLVVERRTGNGTFEQLAEIAGNATTYSDSSVTGGVTYDYRVVGRSPADADRHSYPFRVRVLPTKRFNFHGAPFMIPGVIEAEDYDIGGEGLTYHDTEEANIPGAYRPSEGVDVEPRDDGGFQVAYVESGEWLEYTVDVADDGDYTLTTSVASLNGGGQFRFEFGRRTSQSLIVPSTNSWQTLTTVSTTLALDAGEQIMRFFISSASPFNIDRFVIERVGATAVETDSDPPTFDVFPNPARDWLRVSVTDARSSSVQVELFDSLGRRLRTVTSTGSEEIKVDGLPRGVYVCRVHLGAGVVRFIKVLLV